MGITPNQSDTPGFQEIMLPLLRLCRDGQDHAIPEVRESLAREFNLSEAQRLQVLPSGKQRVFDNRVAWAKSYLQGAGLLVSVRRGVFKISEQGQKVLTENPVRIDVSFLSRYPEFEQFRAPVDAGAGTVGRVSRESAQTPEEAIGMSFQQFRATLSATLLDRIRTATPKFFEELVVDMLVAMGYGGSRKDAGKAVGQSRDEGIDGIISEDRLGLDNIYLQAKRWDGPVGRPEVQKFVGALHGKKARKGVFITTSRFSDEARRYVESLDVRVVLIDGPQLAGLMIDHNVGATTTTIYEIKKVDSDYFDGE